MVSLSSIIPWIMFLRISLCTCSCDFTISYEGSPSVTLNAPYNASVRGTVCPCSLRVYRAGNIKVSTPPAFGHSISHKCASLILKKDNGEIISDGGDIGTFYVNNSTTVIMCFAFGTLLQNGIYMNDSNLILQCKPSLEVAKPIPENTTIQVYRTTHIDNPKATTIAGFTSNTATPTRTKATTFPHFPKTTTLVDLTAFTPTPPRTKTTFPLFSRTSFVTDDVSRISGVIIRPTTVATIDNKKENDPHLSIIIPVTVSSVVVVAVIIGLIIWCRKRKEKKHLPIIPRSTRAPIPSAPYIRDAAVEEDYFVYGLKDNVLYNQTDNMGDGEYSTTFHYSPEGDYQAIPDQNQDTDIKHSQEEPSSSSAGDFPIYAQVNKVRRDVT